MRKNRDYGLICIVAVLVILSFVYIIMSSSLDVYFYIAYYETILKINTGLQIILLLIISYFILKLIQQVRGNIFGAKITGKLFIILSVIAIVPASFNILISHYFINNSINSWFTPQIYEVFNTASYFADEIKVKQIYIFLYKNQHILTNIYNDTLFTSVLLSISIAIVFCVYYAKYLVRPLNDILENTKLIGQGLLTIDANNHSNGSKDELSTLVVAFNQMSRNLEKMHNLELEQKNEITKNKDYLENIINNLNSSVIVFDEQLNVLSINKVSAQILNIDLSQLDGISLNNWHKVYPNLFDLIETILDKNTHNTNYLEFNYKVKLSSNTQKNMYIKVINFGLDSKLSMILISDITNLMSAKQNEVWAEIAKRLAHEIKNPLTPIVLSAERIEMKLMPKLNEVDQGFLSKLIKQIILQVEELKKLVNGFRDFASINKPQLVKVDLNLIITQILMLYEDYSYIKVDIVDKNSDIIVLGDDSLLRQVIHNLLKNSIDAVEHVLVKEVSVAINKDDQYGYIKIKDNGTGFKQDILDNLFEPYQTTKGVKGSGLGLAIVKKIIDEHNGKLDVYNDSGATVIVQLPLFKNNLLRE